TAFAAAPFPIFVWYFDYEVNIRKYNYVWRIVHDLIVNNGRNFFQLNPHFRPTINLSSPIDTLKQWKTILGWFYKPETNPVPLRFEIRQLRYYPNLIPTSRSRFIFRNYLMISFNSIFIIGTVIVLIAGSTYFIWSFVIPNVDGSLRKMLCGSIDVILICCCAFHTIRMILFLLHSLTIELLVYHFIINKLDLYLKKALKMTYKGRWTQKQLSRQLDFFRFEHANGVMNAINANRYIVSPLLLTGSLSNFTFNIYLISALYFLRMAIGEQLLCFAVIVLQILFSLSALLPLISLTACIHHSALLIQDAQYCINGTNYLTKKLKLMTYFELMHTTNQITFTLGPVGKITRKSLMEVSKSIDNFTYNFF
ncbi:MAG: hypothetical protein QRY16_21115, partial [Enterobacterales bacterium endosymbiont of Blomia tropicalis]|uniref:hypothetical protein n=1 Tax=Mixta mediterraneensis TaxID=2758443 RepID=UPI0025A695A0